MKHPLRTALLWVAALVFAAGSGAAQAGGTLSGRLTGGANEPVADALVQVSAPGGTHLGSTRTDARGAYLLRLPSAPGPFFLSVSRLGFAPRREVLPIATAGADRTLDLRLTPQPALLDALEVKVFPPRLRDTPAGPGGQGGSHLAGISMNYPVEPGSIAEGALLSAGVVPLGEASPGVPAVSIAGMGGAQNRVTLDGAAYGGAELPAEAVRSVGVVTSTYDVSRGQFTGGQIAVSTHSGSTDRGGALRVRGRSLPLSWGTSPAAAAPDGSLAQVSAAYGAPLAGRRLFGFGAVQWVRRDWTLGSADPAALRRRGIDPDSVRRFSEVLARAGVPAAGSGIGAAQEGSALFRMDWKASSSHSVFARVDGRWSEAPMPGPSLGMAASSRAVRGGTGALLALTSDLAGGRSELRVSASRGHSRNQDGDSLPAGTVLVGSDEAGVSRFGFGGSSTGASSAERSLVEISESWRRPFAGGRHRLQVGVSLTAERASARSSENSLGSFLFQSLDDLEALRPSSFTRGLAPREGEISSTYAALYAGHAMRVSGPLSATYGIRVEGIRYGERPSLGIPAELLSGAGSSAPATALLSPRAGFAYRVPGPRPGESRVELEGGVGRFMGPLGLEELAYATGETGAPLGGRPVYAEPAAIDSASGLVLPGASRRFGDLETVREVRSGRVEAGQLILQGYAVPRGSSVVFGAYTYTRSRDDAAGVDAPGGGRGYAAADPRGVVLSTSDYERRHSFMLNYARIYGRRFQGGVIARLTSGVPYTPRVSGDVNGDGQWNDAAFIFDPARRDEAGAAMGALLRSAPAGARECLRAQVGRVAGRNSCRGPWTAGLDLQADYAPRGIAGRSGVRITLTASNVPALADWAVHGRDDLRGWGEPAIPNAPLLHTRGFDPARGAYRYEVNPSFGRSLSRRDRSGFALTLQVRMTVGTDPATQWISEARREYQSVGRQPEEIRAEIGKRVRSLPARVLWSADSLRLALDSAQKVSLRRLADSVQLVVPPLLDSLAAAASLADTASAPTLPARVRQRALTGIVQELLEGVQAEVRAILTRAQWELLPAPWREPAGAAPIVPMKPIIISTEEVG
ncbi:MAG TPA: carboxypeptidase-like regulatory domain-containing protein [Longimicrobium sp.]